MLEKITSIGDLARLTHEEFLAAGKRVDGLERKLDAGFKEMRGGFRAVFEILDTVLHEVRQIRRS